MKSIDILTMPTHFVYFTEWLSFILYFFYLKPRFSRKVNIAAFVLMFGALMALVEFYQYLPNMLQAVSGICLKYLVYRCTTQNSRKVILYCSVVNILVMEFTASISWQMDIYLYGTWFYNELLGNMVFLLVAVTTTIGLYLLSRRVLDSELLESMGYGKVTAGIMIALFFFFFSNLSLVLSDIPFTTTTISEILNYRTMISGAGLAILYSVQLGYRDKIAAEEIAMMEALLQNQYEQYLKSNENIEMLHRLSHDLKHQINGIKAERDDQKREQWIEAMEQELQKCDIPLETGNAVLDTILRSAFISAAKYEISLTVVADGKLLDFMNVRDICNLFGNALDNAIEAMMFISDKEKRLIHLSVTRQKNFVFIKINNYCEYAEKFWEGQYPKTSKGNTGVHGYGVKSIINTAEKYGGNVLVDLTNHNFELSVLIPITE